MHRGGEGEGVGALRTGRLLYSLLLLVDVLYMFGQVLTPFCTESAVWTLVRAFARVGRHVALNVVWAIASELT